MSTDNNDKTSGLLANPLPIVMLALLAAGVVVKNVPLESVRPTDPERVKYMPTSNHQDVEARLWQDPFAAIEKHEKSFLEGKHEKCPPGEKNKNCVPVAENKHPHEVNALHERINEVIKRSSLGHDGFTVVAVSVSGGSFVEAAEYRRRSRFAVVSALGFHNYHPENTDAIGYFETTLGKSDTDSQVLRVPYEWYERAEPYSNVLVLWLDEERFTSMAEPFKNLKALFNEVTPRQFRANSSNGLNFKLVGPAGSAMLVKLMEKEKEEPVSKDGKSIDLERGSTLQVFSPNATISSRELKLQVSNKRDDSSKKLTERIPEANPLATAHWIVRTIGTDDTLSVALLWELWQRGVNRESWLQRQWAQRVLPIAHLFTMTWRQWTQLVNNKKDASSTPKCKDGLVLISERDSTYARTLSRNLTDDFSSRCGTDNPSPVRTFTYLRGLDGVLPDIDKSGTNAPHKDNGGKSKDLGAQLNDIPIEHAEGRSQYDYLRRLADEITQLNRDKQFAENGIKAIGIVGSDVYDKLLILQALRNRFKDKIFFTTDLDARYLHADQKDWARNLVVASNFGLSLRPELQQRASPFRDGYQTATYLATLMALEKKNTKFEWNDKMAQWLHPQIFEIGRTEAVRIASPTVEYLEGWHTPKGKGSNPEGIPVQNKYQPCAPNHWPECADIEPYKPLLMPSYQYMVEVFVMVVIGFVLIAMASCRIREKLLAVKDALTLPMELKTVKILLTGVGLLVLGALISLYIKRAMDASYEQGIGEPFVWFEGISVWPSLMLDFIGLVLTPVFAFALWYLIRGKARLISKNFNFVLPQVWILARSRWSAMCAGPYVDLALFNREGTTDPKPVGPGVEVSTLWQNYLRATSMREMMCWIVPSTVMVGILFFVAYRVFEMPSFPHRGQLVQNLNYIVASLNALILWPVIFWVSYQTRACTQLTQVLGNMNNVWPKRLLGRKEAETGVPRAYLSGYLDFQLIMRATQRIHYLIYLPFVSILFMVVARSDLLDAMNFPLVLVFVIGLVLAYALGSEVLLRRGAVAARTKVISYYETLLLRMQAAPKVNLNENPQDGSSSPDTANQSDSAETPISTEQIKLLLERIRNTREGVFAPITEQPALRALLLPFGGFGGAQLIEYLINLTV